MKMLWNGHLLHHLNHLKFEDMELLKNLFRKKEEQTHIMEQHNELLCYCSIDKNYPPCTYGGAKMFYQNYHYSVMANVYDEDWTDDVRKEEVIKRVKIILEDECNDDTVIVYKKHKRIFLENGKFIAIPYQGVFVYDKSEINVKFD